MSADAVDIARLLVTELVSNAVLHAGGTVLLTIARHRGGIRVEVHDQSPNLPVMLEGRPPLEHGNGLRLVSALATSWGTDPRNDSHPGKRVWFTLA
jgi:anti-sigma regulatory factor (Ser/Thr protein kinase)